MVHQSKKSTNVVANHSDIEYGPEQLSSALERIKEGAIFLKYGSRGSPHERRVTVSDDLTYLQWNSKRKKPKHCTIFLKDVNSLTLGQNTHKFQRRQRYLLSRPPPSEYDPKERSFSLSYDQGKTLDLVAANEQQFKDWTNSLAYLVAQMRLEYEKDPLKILILQQWMKADDNSDGRLEFKEICQIKNNLNCDIPNSILEEKFNEADVDGNGVLDYTEFIEFFKKLSEREEVKKIMENLSSSKSSSSSSSSLTAESKSNGKLVLTVPQFKSFLKNVQLQTFEDENEDEEILNIVKNMESSEYDKEASRRLISLYQFTSFLFDSQENSAFDPKQQNILCDKMNQPLSAYWINSSHNTFLEGDQLKSDSSVEMYRKVLEQGCKCLELDLWDGNDGEPIIYHGYTMTSKILVSDVIKCIKEYAFSISPYPVILSFENHCSMEQQQKIASHLNETLGDTIFRPSECPGCILPSPEELKYRILIKGKVSHHHYVYKQDRKGTEEDIIGEEEDKEGEPSDVSSEESDDEENQSEDKSGIEDVSLGGNQEYHNSLAKDEDPDSEYQRTKPHQSKKIAPELSDLVFLASTHFHGFDHPEKYSQMHSFGENKLNRYITKQPLELIKYNNKQLSRTYPKGTRFGSSNFDPVPCWVHGCQLVALNYQTQDSSMCLNKGWFERNGNCGYVLKPKIFSSPNFDPRDTQVRKRLTARVISGHQLPRHTEKTSDIPDPYVDVAVHGVPADNSTHYQTRTIWNNGFNPLWEESFSFPLACPELAILEIRVYHKSVAGYDVLIGDRAIPISCLRMGYRFVPINLHVTGEARNTSTSSDAGLLCFFDQV